MRKMPHNIADSVVSQDELVQLGASKAMEAVKKQLQEINEKAMKPYKNENKNEIAALKKDENKKLKSSQELVSSRYDELFQKYSQLKTDKETQNIKRTMLEWKTNFEVDKLGAVDSYSRLHNLKFQGVPESENNDIVKVVIDIGKALGVNDKNLDISTAHRKPKRCSSHRKAISEPPARIARLVNTELKSSVLEVLKLHFGRNELRVNIGLLSCILYVE